MQSILLFSLIVGIGSTVMLDFWLIVIQMLTGQAPTNWGLIGRWLKNLHRGQWQLDSRNNTPPTGIEKSLGWGFHYLVGISYAVMLPLFFGLSYMDNPTILPIFLIGLLLSTFAGFAILVPAMGGGFLGRKLPNLQKALGFSLMAHAVFAIAQYVFALIFVEFVG